jgi:hypothetical protein
MLLCLLPMTASAGARHFTFVYEATTSAPGSVETENWATWSRTSDPARSHELAFRHEFEFGITDKFQASVYLADWFYGRDAGHPEFTYSDSAIELIYNVTSPVADPIGLSVYEEVKAGDRVLELETKLIAQKNFGRWIVAYNATLEAAWEGEHLRERTGEFQQALGISREISPSLSIGAELLHEFVFEDWRDAKHIRNFFVGPNISYRRGGWFVTVSALARATSTPNEPDLQVRAIFGIGL